MLAEAVRLLACPLCGSGLTESVRALRCEHDHSFDLARQGYVNLLSGGAPAGLGDTAEMVAARARFLHAGHFDPLLRAVAEAAREAAGDESGAVVEVGSGTGHYLAAALDEMPGRAGLALDASRFAARRAARAHPHAGAAVCDVWRSVPVRAGAARVLIDVFAPRNGAEMARILARGGTVLVVTPTQRHLAELREPLAMLAVDEHKAERVNAALGTQLVAGRRTEIETEMELDHASLRDLATMGPSARHTDRAALDRRISALSGRLAVTASVTLTRWRLGPDS
jgi:23S rRNA (guanine745-N1)-methyltransferase